jgi:hypothetical protein
VVGRGRSNRASVSGWNAERRDGDGSASVGARPPTQPGFPDPVSSLLSGLGAGARTMDVGGRARRSARSSASPARRSHPMNARPLATSLPRRIHRRTGALRSEARTRGGSVSRSTHSHIPGTGDKSTGRVSARARGGTEAFRRVSRCPAMFRNSLEQWRRARDSNPQRPCGPVDFKFSKRPALSVTIGHHWLQSQVPRRSSSSRCDRWLPMVTDGSGTVLTQSSIWAPLVSVSVAYREACHRRPDKGRALMSGSFDPPPPTRYRRRT